MMGRSFGRNAGKFAGNFIFNKNAPKMSFGAKSSLLSNSFNNSRSMLHSISQMNKSECKSFLAATGLSLSQSIVLSQINIEAAKADALEVITEKSTGSGIRGRIQRDERDVEKDLVELEDVDDDEDASPTSDG